MTPSACPVLRVEKLQTAMIAIAGRRMGKPELAALLRRLALRV